MSQSKRRSREDLRELVLGAALDLIRNEGLGAEPTTVSYQRVFDHLEKTNGVRVTRASVHERIWESQDHFQHDVLLRASQSESGIPQTTDIAADTFERTQGLPPLARMTEMTRVAAPANLAVSEADDLFYSWVGMTMSMAKDPRLQDSVRAELADATSSLYAGFKKQTVALLKSVAASIGMRPRRDLFPPGADCYETIAQLGIALSEGVSVCTRFDKAELPDVELNTGADGEAQSWTAFAAGYWALLNTFLEVDPDVHPESAVTDPA
jgi:hypothetical protein